MSNVSLIANGGGLVDHLSGNQPGLMRPYIETVQNLKSGRANPFYGKAA